MTVLSLIGAGSSLAAARYPEVGCYQSGVNGFRAHYKPKACTLVPRNKPVAENDIATVSDLKWSDWGANTATATGEVTYCGTGCTTVSVRLQAFHLLNHRNPYVCKLGGSIYSRIRLTDRYGSLVYNVTPDQAGGCDS